MKTHRTTRYRLYPAMPEKHQKPHGTAGACRYAWNYFIGKLRDDYVYYRECDFRFFSISREILKSVWGKLEQCLGYKMNALKVSTRHTSQTCNKCGIVDKNNGKTQADFKCIACGHSDNADVNTALNILAVGNGATGVEMVRLLGL